MVFVFHKFKHYLIVFCVDDMALVYLMNKPHVLGCIVKWLLLFLEYEFTIIYNPSRTHVMENAFSRLFDNTKPTKVMN
jgi:hypothetical protein